MKKEENKKSVDVRNDSKDKKNLKNTKVNKGTSVKNTENTKKNGNFFKKIGKYFRGVLKEIKRIRWTTGKDLFKYSVATVIFVLFFGLYFYAIDWIVLLVRSLAK